MVDMARILIVDDEPYVRNALSRALREHELVTAANGQEALELLSGDEQFDLVLCDLMMPGFSGVDLYQHLTAAQPGREAALVFLTGGVFTDDVQDFVAQIPNPVIQKPFDFQQLRRIVSERAAANSRPPED